jgi:glycosyltransferase involved in cell wall biosynthesis
MTNQNLPEVSVCVCTYQRPNSLLLLLESLARQRYPLEHFEVIVVDNDAKGTARHVVELAAQRFPALAIRYVIEFRQGISYARNRTVSLASGNLLAFIDDDETAVPDWLGDLLACMTDNEADAVLGPVIPNYPASSRAWAVSSGFFERSRFPTGTEIGCDTCRTGNALIKAQRLKSRQPNPFDERLARSGGEDHDFFKWCAGQGGKFVWCDTAVVHEEVPLHRQRLGFILERCLRTSARYWRDEYVGHPQSWVLRKVLAGLVGGAVLILFGVLLFPFSPGRSVRALSKGTKGLGRAAALGNLSLVGYGGQP